jgi:hypothetical protein
VDLDNDETPGSLPPKLLYTCSRSVQGVAGKYWKAVFCAGALYRRCKLPLPRPPLFPLPRVCDPRPRLYPPPIGCRLELGGVLRLIFCLFEGGAWLGVLGFEIENVAGFSIRSIYLGPGRSGSLDKIFPVGFAANCTAPVHIQVLACAKASWHFVAVLPAACI